MLGSSTSMSPLAPNTTPLYTKQQRNHGYYEQNKATIKENKVNYCFKIEVNKEEQGRLAEIRKQISSVRSHLLSNSKSIGNVDVMEALLNCWLSRETRDGSSSGQQTTSFSASLPQICSSLDRDAQPPEIFLEPKTQLHSSCNEKDENYLVCGSALQRLFRYFIDGKGRCKCWENIDLSTLNLKRVTPNNHCVKAILKCTANSSKHTYVLIVCCRWEILCQHEV